MVMNNVAQFVIIKYKTDANTVNEIQNFVTSYVNQNEAKKETLLRPRGIEPRPSPWKGEILPLN